MSRKIRDRFAPALALSVLAAMFIHPAHAGTIVKANNSDNLDLSSSWTSGVIPGSGDIVQWDSTVTSAKTVLLGSNRSWLGLAIIDPGGNITISAGSLLTLGSAGVASNPNLTITLNNAITLGAPQTWDIDAGTFIPAGGVNNAGFVLTLDGAGTKQFKNDITGGGAVFIQAGQLKLSGSAKATASAVTAYAGTTLAFDTSTGAASAARTDSITLIGATLTAGGLSSTSPTESNAHALKIGPGKSTITVTPNAASSTLLSSGSFIRQAGGVALLRGSSLGVNPSASATSNSANVVFGISPALIGSGSAGTTTLGIVAGAYGDITTAGNGSGLVTYDSTYGIRLLNSSTETKPSITSGQTQLDNVRLSNSSGLQLTSTINASTAINSLSFLVSSSTGSGITISGSGTLKINSGVIWGTQSIATSTSQDAMIISGITLDLNGREGLVLFNTLNSGSSGEGGGPLEVDSLISNDGGNGVTFCGSGLVKLSGSVASTYTGPTTHLAGNLWLVKSGTNAIPGNLIINGGSVINPSNQIPDTADITINGGSLAQKSSLNSGSGASETFRDLFMTGGSYSDGTGGTSSGATFLRNATLSGGTWTISGGHKTMVSGSTGISGGAVITVSAGHDSGHSTIFTANNALTITNTPLGSYTPLIISSSSTDSTLGGQVLLQGDVTFIGNSTNTNSVLINTPSPAGTGNLGIISLSGTRVFNIGDGSADDDLTISTPLVDSTSTGGLIKTGAGTLVLAGTNSYTGSTTVNSGTLRIASSFAGDVAVNNSSIEFQSDLLSPGSLAINGTSRALLDHIVSFNAVTINSVVLAPGIYSYAVLVAAYPNIFTGSSASSAIIVQGATWHLAADQSVNLDWNSLPGTGWAYNPNGTGTNPFTINPYDFFDTNGHLLRTALTSSTFAGGVLELVAGSTLALQTATGETSTIPNLYTTGGTISNLATGNSVQNLVVNEFTNNSGTTTLSASGGKGISLTVDLLSGPGNLSLNGGGSFLLNFTDATNYTGTVTLLSGTLDLELPSSGNPLSSAGALTISPGTTVILNEWAYFTGLTISGSSKPPGTYSAGTLGLSGTAGIVVYTLDLTGPPQMFGLNLACGEFGSKIPGTYLTDYAYPTDAELAYYQAKGLCLIRMPFRWERLQRSLNAALDATEMARVDAVVGYAHARGMKLILDMHNYNSYSISGTGYQVGSPQVPYSAYQNVWSQLADHYKAETAVYGYDIMNEPGGTLDNWMSAAQGAVHAIRLKDTIHYVFMEGISFSGAQSWLSSNYDLNIVDPVNRLIYSAHSYWDKDYQNWTTNWKFDGTYASYTQEGGYPEMGADLIADFIGWLQERGYHGHIGEFGVPKDDTRWNTVLDKALSTMQSAGLCATYWAGGPRWSNYPLSCEPTSNYTVDAAQMSVLQNYRGATFASWKSNYFSPLQLADPVVSGILASPAGDGVGNLLDYAFGLNPTIAYTSASASQVALAANQLTITFPRNKSASDLTYSVEVSGNLQTWNSGSGYTSPPVVLSDDGFTQTIQTKDLILSSSNSHRFIRLRVTNP